MPEPEPSDRAAARLPPRAPELIWPAALPRERARTSPLFWLALALGLMRFYRLGEWSLWVDEVFTLHDSLRLSDGIFGNEPRNPLGYLLISWVARLSDGWPDELELRLLPAVCGWLGIALTGWAFAPFVGARRAGAAALLVSVSSWHVYWSQNARFYTLAQDLSLVGGALVLRGLFASWPGRGAAWKVLAGLVLGGIGALAHPSAGLLLPAWIVAAAVLPRLGVIPVAHARAAQRMLLAVGILGVLAMAIWARDVWLDFLAAKPSPSLGHLALTSGNFFTPLLAAASVAGAWVAWRERSTADVFAALTCAFVVAAAVASSFFVQASAKYAFALLPWVALLATLPFSSAPDSAGERRPRNVYYGIWLCALTLPALCDCGLYFTLRHGDRPRWREAFAFVWKERGSDDLVLANSASVGEYYLAPHSADLKQPLAVVKLNRASNGVERNWARQGRRTWFVINREQLTDWSPRDRELFEAMLARDCRLARVFPVLSGTQDLAVSVYVRE